MKIPDTDWIMIKPTGFSLGYLRPSDIAIIDSDGKKVGGKHQPSSEVPFHVALYKARPDIAAVVHTHSRYATAFGIAGKDLLSIWNEGSIARGVPVARYCTGGTNELAKVIVETMGDKYAVILQNHGVVTVGASLESAYQTALDVEWLAQMQFVATLVGEPKQLEHSEIEQLVRDFGGNAAVQPDKAH